MSNLPSPTTCSKLGPTVVTAVGPKPEDAEDAIVVAESCGWSVSGRNRKDVASSVRSDREEECLEADCIQQVNRSG